MPFWTKWENALLSKIIKCIIEQSKKMPSWTKSENAILSKVRKCLIEQSKKKKAFLSKNVANAFQKKRIFYSVYLSLVHNMCLCMINILTSPPFIHIIYWNIMDYLGGVCRYIYIFFLLSSWGYTLWVHVISASHSVYMKEKAVNIFI